VADRVGEERLNNFGSKMIIVEYRKTSDIDVMFPEYNNYIVKNKQYSHFKKGAIACPSEERTEVSRNKTNENKIVWKNKLNQNEYNLELLIKYIKENPDKCFGKEDICKQLGVYRKFLDKVEKIENIKFEYNFNVNSINSIYFKAIYQDYDWCYQKYMTEGLNHEEMAKEAKCSKRVIEKWCCEKHKLTQEYRKIHKQLNDIQKDLVIGSLLGDGHVDKRETQPIFIVSHAENQKDYLFWKYELMKDFMNISPTYYKEAYHNFGTDSKYLCQPHYRISSRIHNCFIQYREMSKRNLIDNLNEFSLSIFALDDGYRGDSNWEICLADIPLKDRYHFIDIMKNRFDLDGIVENSDKRYMRFTAKSSRKLDEIITSIIPNNLDIIKCKIIENDKIKQEQFRFYINYNNNDILLKDFCDILSFNYQYIHYAIKRYRLKDGEEIINFMNDREENK